MYETIKALQPYKMSDFEFAQYVYMTSAKHFERMPAVELADQLKAMASVIRINADGKQNRSYDFLGFFDTVEFMFGELLVDREGEDDYTAKVDELETWLNESELEYSELIILYLAKLNLLFNQIFSGDGPYAVSFAADRGWSVWQCSSEKL